MFKVTPYYSVRDKEWCSLLYYGSFGERFLVSDAKGATREESIENAFAQLESNVAEAKAKALAEAADGWEHQDTLKAGVIDSE